MIALIVSAAAKLATKAIISNEMVNFDTTRRVTANLYNAGKHFLSSSIQGDEQSRRSGESQDPQAKHSTEYLVYNWLDSLFAWIQMVMLWHDPALSVCAIFGLSISFLLLTFFAPRLYATILIMIFVYNMTKVWFRHVWPEIRVPVEPEKEEESRLDVDRWTYLHPQLMTMGELRHLGVNLANSGKLLIEKLLDLRRQKPITFALTICSTLSCTAYIGNRVNGLTLLFICTLLAATAPGIYLHLLPESAKRLLNLYARCYIFPYTQKDRPQLESKPNQEAEAETDIESAAIGETANLTPSEDPTMSPPASQPYSLYDHLRRFSFRSDDSSDKLSQPILAHETLETAQGPRDNVCEGILDISTANRSGTMTAPKATTPGRRVSEDLSSIGESASLIDFDDEQQDGFVIL